ncbi:MAG TPA: SH3 domain-containing protein [Gemmatimonadaceae bacterium]
MRDGFGELLPLEHCPTCDTHYPARQGACRWCGTRPEGFRIAPYAWKGAGVLACIGLGWGAWAASRGTGESSIAALSPNEGQSTLTTVVDSGIAARRRVRVAVADTALDSLLAAVATIDTSPPVDSMPIDSLSAQPTAEPVAAPMPSPVVIDSAPVRRAPAVATRAPTSSKATTVRPSRTARWMRATARNWVTVRAAASRSSRVIASIGPDTRVQLGEARGEWMRIRMKGINGWVERSRF